MTDERMLLLYRKISLSKNVIFTALMCLRGVLHVSVQWVWC